MSNEFDDHGFPIATLVTIFVLSVSLAMALGNYIDPLYIWGGMECSPPGEYGIKACTGYVPLLIFPIIALSAGIVLYGRQILLQSEGEYDELE